MSVYYSCMTHLLYYSLFHNSWMNIAWCDRYIKKAFNDILLRCRNINYHKQGLFFSWFEVYNENMLVKWNILILDLYPLKKIVVEIMIDLNSLDPLVFRTAWCYLINIALFFFKIQDGVWQPYWEIMRLKFPYWVQ